MYRVSLPDPEVIGLVNGWVGGTFPVQVDTTRYIFAVSDSDYGLWPVGPTYLYKQIKRSAAERRGGYRRTGPPKTTTGDG